MGGCGGGGALHSPTFFQDVPPEVFVFILCHVLLCTPVVLLPFTQIGFQVCAIELG